LGSAAAEFLLPQDFLARKLGCLVASRIGHRRMTARPDTSSRGSPADDEGRTINEHVRAVDVTPRGAASAKCKMLSCPDPVACYESGKTALARQPAERAAK
jgi:hypothetical protein